MKIRQVLMIFAAAGSIITHAATITSVSNGLWSSTATWSPAQVPGVSDAVIINSNVNLDANPTVASLTINSGKVFQDNGGTYTITVSGNITNNGTILRHPALWYFEVFCKGNIVNNGVWKPFKTTLNGTTNQSISGSGKFENQFVVNDTLGDIYLQSPVSFEGNTLDMNNARLYTNGFTLSTLNQTIQYIRIIGNDTIMLHRGAFSNIAFSGNTILKGTAYFMSGNSAAGSFTVIDSLLSNYGTYSITISGNLINKGVILRDPASWYNRFYIAGNIENYGIWNPFETILNGTTNQTIQTGANTWFENSFVISDTLGDIVLLSNAAFKNSTITGNAAKLLTNGHQLITQSQEIVNLNINGNDTLFLNQSVLNTCNLNGNIKLKGRVQYKQNVVANGTLTNMDTLISNWGTYTININGDFINKGYFLRDPDSWYNRLYITGNIENYGKWNPFQTYLSGNLLQSIKQGNNVWFENEVIITDTIGDVKLTSNCLFKNSTFTGNGAKLLTNGYQLITLAEELVTLNITGNDTLNLHQSVLNTCNLNGNIKLKGRVQYKHNVVANGTLTNIDTLISNWGTYSININGDFINKGFLLRDPDSWYNRIYITGNIENYGKWNPFETYLSGSGTQTIKEGNNAWFENAFIITDTTGDNKLISNCTFKNNTINGNGGRLLTNGYQLITVAEELTNLNINGNDTLNLNQSVLSNLNLNGNIRLRGRVQYKQNVVANGTLTILDTLISNWGTYSININGNLINKGALLRDPDSWYNRVYVTGNIENYGKWNPFETWLTGLTDQGLKSSPTSKFENGFIIADTNGKTILNSDIRFEDNTLDLKGSVLSTNNYQLNAVNEAIVNGTILSDDTFYFYNSTLQNIQLKGDYKVTGKLFVKDGNTFYGNFTLLDTLMDNYGSYVLFIKGNLINHGVIQRAPSNWYFKLYCSGNVYNQGIMNPYEIYLFDTTTRNFGGASNYGLICNVYVDDSIRLTGNNVIPTLGFTGNSKAWCTLLPSGTLVLNNPNIGSRLINYGAVTVNNDIDTSASAEYAFFMATVRNKAKASSTKISMDHFGYQQHSTTQNAMNQWWRLRNTPQSFTDTLQYIRFKYADVVLNGNNPDSLKVYHSANAGIKWNRIANGVSIDKTNKLITVNNAPSYGHYVITDGIAGFLSFNPELDRAEPRFGGNSGSVTMYLFGAGFKKTSIVKLHKTGSTDIAADTAYITDATGESMLAVFNLKSKSLGMYDVVVETPGDPTLTLPSYFDIRTGDRSKPWVMFTGRDRFLINRWQTFNLTYGNTANTDARGTMLMFTISDKPGLEVTFPDFRFVLPKGVKDLGPSYTRIADSVPLYYVSDTFSGFEGQRIRVYAIYVPVIPAQSSKSVRVKIKTTGSGDLAMNAWLLDPWFETIDLYGKTSDPMPNEVRLCITAAAMKAFANGMVGMIPGAGCYSLVDKVVDPIGHITPDDMKPGEAEVVGSGLWGWVSWASSITQCATSFMPGLGQATSFGIAVAGFIVDGVDNKLTNEGCWAKFKRKSGNKLNSKGVSSFDPNEMVGPQGYSSDNYITRSGNKQYKIYFENKATASAPALEVFIYDTLDKSKYDLNTFSFGTITFGDTTVHVQAYAKAFSQLVDMYPKQNVVVQIAGILDTSNGSVYMAFHSLDRISLELTEYDSLGFLPPNKTSPQGEGNIAFSVAYKNTLAHKDYVKNKATIVFDFNAPIVTNEYGNRIDNVAPVSSVTALPATTKDSVFVVKWSGTDDGCGIRNYNIFVSENDSAYTLWRTNTPLKSDTFRGRNFNRYQFFSLASDSLGLTEIMKTVAEASIQVYNNTGFEDLPVALNHMTVYPNPSNGSITVRTITTGETTLYVRVIDLTGRLLLQKQYQTQAGFDEHPVNLAGLPTGMYLIQAGTGESTRTFKIRLNP